jgi:hypothetical protein
VSVRTADTRHADGTIDQIHRTIDQSCGGTFLIDYRNSFSAADLMVKPRLQRIKGDLSVGGKAILAWLILFLSRSNVDGFPQGKSLSKRNSHHGYGRKGTLLPQGG